MSNIAIKVENLSKAYQLGQIGTGTISRDLERWYARIRGKEDPFLRIGESNNQNTKSESDVVWSLKDINFEIEQGDAVGIIGKNGAGKSTLLKILSKVTAPTTGKISGKGRIASLLEVGTGFHPELSGRENIFLNGAILGMRKKEIQRKLDEIVDFAGIERYLDTPVKRYSSGMYVRLAFAVAAHLESEILIVDEVLAVGDAEFQKKCLSKMGEVSKGEGRTVLFVSHNMASIKNLCTKGIVLENGLISLKDEVDRCIVRYLNNNKENYYNHNLSLEEINDVRLISIGVFDHQNINLTYIDTDTEFYVKIAYELKKENTVGFTLGFWNQHAEIVFISISNPTPFDVQKPGFYESVCKIERSFLNNINYSISLNIYGRNFENPQLLNDVLTIKVEDGINIRKNYIGGYEGMIRPNFEWQINKRNEII
ncbi:hypothetical protein CA265_01795 [Sphingobacteriaceae bacterium GW460-11-11-14-LB5]|nr:hypothetical protein CA265_01795 [Sphingobacteriaceae bacterium GW460-11-11-14-LB5]